MRRFKRIYEVVEPVEEYRRGGYHPVRLDDVFNQRHKILGKLAFGQFSTVLLAQDQL
jgi:serine/threonine-protein kinase SRPK3